MSCLVFTACYEDDTTLGLNEIPSVEFRKDDYNKKVSISQLDYVRINPVQVTEFREETDDIVLSEEPYILEMKTTYIDEEVEYTWEIGSDLENPEFEVIHIGKNLDYQMDLQPSPSTWQPYLLRLVVYDKANDIKQFFKLQLVVNSIIGEGLAISETKDGVTCDISLLMTPEVTKDYTTVRILRNLYSDINGENVNGIIKKLCDGTVKYVKKLFAITDNSIMKLSCDNIEVESKDLELFSYTPENLIVQNLTSTGNGPCICVVDDQLYMDHFGGQDQFCAPFDFAYKVPGVYSCNYWYNANWFKQTMCFYQEELGKFMYVSKVPDYWTPAVINEFADDLNSDFNPNDLPGKQNIAAGQSHYRNMFIHILKDKASGSMELYLINGNDSNGPTASRKIDLSGAPEIDNALGFDFSDDKELLYYYTDKKIYGVSYGSSTPFIEEKYSFDGEEITTCHIFQQAYYQGTYSTSGYYPMTNNMIVASTYSNEGKIYFLPMKDSQLGNIDKDNIQIFNGFDRITAIGAKR